MTQGSPTTSVRTDEPEEISLSIGAPVLDMLEYEAQAFGAGLARTEFARVLLRNKANLVRAVRSEHAKTHRPLANVEHERARLPLVLAPAELGILVELSNVLGRASKSMVMAHLVLDWAGISPLRPGVVFEVTQRLQKLRARGKRIPRSTKLTLLQLAPEIHALLRRDAELLGLRKPKDVLIAVLNAQMGDGTLHRPEHFPTRSPLRNVHHDKTQLGVYLPEPHRDLLRETSCRLGGAELSSIASHFVLEWMGISPLSDGYQPQGAPKQSAAKRRAGAKRKTAREAARKTPTTTRTRARRTRRK